MSLQERIKIRLGPPMGVVDDTRTIGAFMQGCPDAAGFTPRLFCKASPLVDKSLLLLGSGFKHIDKRHLIAVSAD